MKTIKAELTINNHLLSYFSISCECQSDGSTDIHLWYGDNDYYYGDFNTIKDSFTIREMVIEIRQNIKRRRVSGTLSKRAYEITNQRLDRFVQHVKAEYAQTWIIQLVDTSDSFE